MSANCLVTQLKGTVDNDNLPIFGKGILDIYVTSASAGTPVQLHYAGKDKIEFELIEGNNENFTYPDHHTFMSKSGNTITVNKEGTYISNSASWFPIRFTAPGHYKVRYDKYVCRPFYNAWDGSGAVGWVGVSVNDVKYYDSDLGIYDSPSLIVNFMDGALKDIKDILSEYFATRIILWDGAYVASNMAFDISEFNLIEDLTYIEASLMAGITGNLSSLLNHPNKGNITNLTLSNCGNIGGDLNAVLPSFPSLTEFNGENDHHYTGNLETIAANFIAAGRQAGTSLIVKGNMQNVIPNPTASGKRINFISDGQGGVTYEIVNV